MSSVDYVCAIVSASEGRRVVSPKQHSPSGRMGDLRRQVRLMSHV